MSQKGNKLVRAFGVGNGISCVSIAETKQSAKSKRMVEDPTTKLFIFTPRDSAKALYSALTKSSTVSVDGLVAKLQAKLGALDSTPATMTIGGTSTPITICDRVGYHFLVAEALKADKLAGVVDLVEDEQVVVS